MKVPQILDSNSELLRLIAAFEQFDGACDPAFDNQLDEVERQIADLRFATSNNLN